MKSFKSKILLFGEYSVILDSMALATPYSLFEGQLVFPKTDETPCHAVDSNKEMHSFATYVKDLIKKGKLPKKFFDTSSFEFDLSQGLYFNSSIPQGHGVGSSGALCAALFERYAEKQAVEELKGSLKELKQIFSLLESHFHGASSGMDPLISFVDRTLLIKSKNDLIPVDFNPPKKDKHYTLFLLNTGRSRRTEPLVNLFLEKCKDPDFYKKCEDHLKQITNQCIVSFLENNVEQLWDSFSELSTFQLENFEKMIPPLFKEIWQDGKLSNLFRLKLCGSGGGGFLLGLTKNFEEVCLRYPEYRMRKVYSL